MHKTAISVKLAYIALALGLLFSTTVVILTTAAASIKMGFPARNLVKLLNLEARDTFVDKIPIHFKAD
jgi:hypothetical protein